MAVSSPLTKLSVVVHVGSLSGVVRNSSQTSQKQLLNKYELYGCALDVCRQILTQTACMTEPYKIKVTKDAVDEGGSKEFESLTLVPASPCSTVGNRNMSVVLFYLKLRFNYFRF